MAAPELRAIRQSALDFRKVILGTSRELGTRDKAVGTVGLNRVMDTFRRVTVGPDLGLGRVRAALEDTITRIDEILIPRVGEVEKKQADILGGLKVCEGAIRGVRLPARQRDAFEAARDRYLEVARNLGRSTAVGVRRQLADGHIRSWTYSAGSLRHK